MASVARKEARLSVRLVWVFARVSRDPARARELFAREKLGPAEYFNPETRLAHSVVMDLLKRHVDAGDANIGLRAGEGVVPGDFAVLEYAARSCPTLGDAIRCFARYVGLLNEAMEISLVEEGPHVLYRSRITDGVGQPPAANDFVMASADAFAKHYCRYYEPPVEVRFAHPEPAYAAAYGKVFETTVRFGAPDNVFVLTRAQLATPLKSSHPAMRSEYESHAEEILASIRGSTGTTVLVRRLLLTHLRTGGCTMATMARKLAMSVPTLRRRLEEEGVTYEAVLDEVRYDLAKRYLADPRITTTDVAFLVGFHHASSFSKAFRRWTGGVSSVEFRGRAAETRGDVPAR
jgi:AraC-like DNA-binding protein